MTPSIYACTVAWRALEVNHVQALIRLLREPSVGYECIAGDALITRARAKAAYNFLKTERDVMLMLDSDIVFSAKQLMLMCQQAHEMQALVAGAYVTRSRSRSFPTSMFEKDDPILFADDPTPRQIRWAATGCLAVPRKVIEALVSDAPLCHPSTMPFYPIFDPFVVENDDGELIYLSEDWAFCERARQAGFEVYVNPAIRLVHLGQAEYRLEDMMQKPIEGLLPITLTRYDDGGARYRAEVVEPEPAGEPAELIRAGG